MSNIVTINSSAIRQHGELYSLNDLHKASGNNPNHKPVFFLRLDQTRDLINEINKGADMHLSRNPVQTQRGAQGGTYACRELVVAYAAWISAAFHLKVIRAFLNAETKAPEVTFRRRRFFVTLEDGKEHIQPLDWDECVLKYQDLPSLIADPNNMLEASLLIEIGRACLERVQSKFEGLLHSNKVLREKQRVLS